MPALFRNFRSAAPLLIAASLLACEDGPAPVVDPPIGTGELDLSVCDPDRGPFSLVIDNPFFPLAVGRSWTLDGSEDDVAIHLLITVPGDTEEVAGVVTLVMAEWELEDGELVEVSRNFFAQAPDRTVCYFGEDVDDYEDGVIVDHHSAWRAGVGDNRPGIIMPGNPTVGMSYDQEAAPGVAMDHAEIIAMGDPVTVPAGVFANTLTTEETNPLEPDSVEVKHYARGVGLLVDGPVALTSFGLPGPR